MPRQPVLVLTKINRYIGIFSVYFDPQTKIQFEQIKTNSKFFEKDPGVIQFIHTT